MSLSPITSPKENEPKPTPKVVELNLLRWRKEQEKHNEKEKRYRERALRSLALKITSRPPKEHEVKAEVRHLKQQAHEMWLLKNCRATVGEILKSHGGSK